MDRSPGRIAGPSAQPGQAHTGIVDVQVKTQAHEVQLDPFLARYGHARKAPQGNLPATAARVLLD